MSEAGRVIAGTARGIRLLAPGPGTRPISDRVKQTLFAILEPDIPGARFLDLFAGSGAAGIEALSRGAAHATLVEQNASAARTIHENLRRAGVSARAEVVTQDVVAYLRQRRGTVDPFDLVVVDPPYAQTELLRSALESLGSPDARLLGQDARVVAKHFWRDIPPERAGLLASDRQRRFGETALTFYRSGSVAGEAQAGQAQAGEADATETAAQEDQPS